MSRIGSSIAVIAASLVMVSVAWAQAPNYQPVRVDLVGYYGYSPSDKGAAHGVGLAIEPKYNLTDNLALGLRLEAAGFVSQSITVKQGTGTRDASISQGGRGLYTFLAKADYYLTTSSVRPFAGFGAGLYRVGAGSQKISSGSGSDVSLQQSAGAFSGFGFCPQLGINFGGFRLALAYHVILGGKTTIVSQTVGTAEPTKVKPDYNFFSFEIGGTFGGNRREAPIAPPPATPPISE